MDPRNQQRHPGSLGGMFEFDAAAAAFEDAARHLLGEWPTGQTRTRLAILGLARVFEHERHGAVAPFREEHQPFSLRKVFEYGEELRQQGVQQRPCFDGDIGQSDGCLQPDTRTTVLGVLQTAPYTVEDFERLHSGSRYRHGLE